MTNIGIRLHPDQRFFILDTYGDNQEAISKFQNFLADQGLNNLLHQSYSEKDQILRRFESRVESSQQLNALMNAIERYCTMYRIQYSVSELSKIH